MKNIFLALVLLLLVSCNADTQEKKGKKKKKAAATETAATTSTLNNAFTNVAQLPKKLKEISGIAKDGNYLWAISDNPKSDIYKLDLSGNVVQQISIGDVKVSDVEDVAVDAEYLYIADVGDNDGSRGDRQIIKIKKSALGTTEKVQANGEIIQFSFPDQGNVKKKNNDYDCEAIFSLSNALYLFTKRRNDGKTELFMLPKSSGKQTVKYIAEFDSKGLITGAAINESGTEVALVGYQKGHQQPFIWLLNGFTGGNFFSGKQQQFVLTNERNDWQVESITFKDTQTLLFACEETQDEAATLYSIDKKDFK
jgi:hypothetical protein